MELMVAESDNCFHVGRDLCLNSDSVVPMEPGSVTDE
jgi:hypothetical protein